MHDSRIILFEKDGHWAIALRRELNGDAVRVFETRSPEDCLDAVAQRPTSFVAVELTGKNVDPVYRCVAEIRDQYPQARVVVLSCAELESLELEMREAGAVHIVYSPRQLATVARLVEKHVASIPAPKMNLRQSVLSRLPWRV